MADSDRPYYRTGDRAPHAPREWFRPVVAVLVALVFAGALWYAFTRIRGAGGEPGQVPLIRADQAATKVKPDQPGGEAISDQDTAVYNMGKTAPQAEKLLPPPEQPMPKPVAPPPPPPPPPPAPAAAVPVVPAAPLPVTPKPPPTTPTPAPAQAAPAPSAGGFRVQIAATKDEATAHKEWQRIQAAHSDLLGALGLTIERADLGERGVFFRIQAGPIPDRAAADKLCAALKAAIGGCIVVKVP
jgi:cell division septation protein DedD